VEKNLEGSWGPMGVPRKEEKKAKAAVCVDRRKGKATLIRRSRENQFMELGNTPIGRAGD